MAGNQTRTVIGALWALLGALAVVVSVAGGLVTLPLSRAGLLDVGIVTAGALGVLALATSPQRLRTSVVWLLPAFWLAFVLWAPYALARTPDLAAGQLEISRLHLCIALSLLALGASRGTFMGATGLRLGWFAGLTLSVAIAGWEMLTSRHLFIGPANPWIFGDGQAVGTFINPNNFATALVAMIAGSLALAATLRVRWAEFVVLVVVALGGGVVLITLSRSGLLALVVVLALEARRRLLERAAAGAAAGRFTGGPAAASSSSAGAAPPKAGPRARRRLRWIIGGVAVVATFVIPPLSQRNPLARVLFDQFDQFDQFDEETARSDSLRVQLIAASWRYLREAGWLGSGAGSFEPLLWNDPDPGTIKLTNLHNAFMELLTQYGVHIGAMYAAIVIGVVMALWCARRLLRRSTRIARYEACGHLVCVLALGVAASSAMHVPLWWVSLAAACACAWQVEVATRAALPRTGAADAAVAPDAAVAAQAEAAAVAAAAAASSAPTPAATAEPRPARTAAPGDQRRH